MERLLQAGVKTDVTAWVYILHKVLLAEYTSMPDRVVTDRLNYFLSEQTGDQETFLVSSLSISPPGRTGDKTFRFDGK